MYFIIVIFTLCAIVYSYHLRREVCALDTRIAYVMTLYMFDLSNIVSHDRFVLLDEMIVSRQRAHNLYSLIIFIHKTKKHPLVFRYDRMCVHMIKAFSL